MKIIAGVHAEFSGRDAARRPAGPLPLARATRWRPASAWCTRSSASRPTCRWPRTCFSARSRSTASASSHWRRHGARGAASNCKSLGIDVDPRARLGDLPIGLQQLIEIARVLFSGARIIILDEPTSALSPPEVERLFATLRTAARRAAAASSSSRISSTTSCASPTRSRCSATAGRSPSAPAAAIDKGWLDRAHDRRRPRGARGELHRRDRARQPPSDRAGGAGGRAAVARPQPVETFRFEARAGEVLGIYGFMGCGQLELARTLFGKLQA